MGTLLKETLNTESLLNGRERALKHLEECKAAQDLINSRESREGALILNERLKTKITKKTLASAINAEGLIRINPFEIEHLERGRLSLNDPENVARLSAVKRKLNLL